MRERDLLNIVLVFWALHGLITKMKNKHSDPYLIQTYESNIFGTNTKERFSKYLCYLYLQVWKIHVR